MKKHKHLKATREYHKANAFTGHIEDQEVYERVKNEEVDWKPHIKSQIAYYRVPADVFEYLLELDRNCSAAAPTRPTRPTRPTGTWTLHVDGSATCSECNTTQKGIWDADNYQNFCGHCGAKMNVGD